MLLRKTIGFSLVLSLLGQSLAFAQAPPAVDDSRINEYFFNQSGRDVLRPVRVLGGIQKPGLYHIPEKTPLVTLMTLSGGTTPDADTKSIIVKRLDGTVLERDLFKLMTKPDQEVSLLNGDVVYIPRKEGLIDNTSATTITTIVSIISVLLTTYVVVRTDRQ